MAIASPRGTAQQKAENGSQEQQAGVQGGQTGSAAGKQRGSDYVKDLSDRKNELIDRIRNANPQTLQKMADTLNDAKREKGFQDQEGELKEQLSDQSENIQPLNKPNLDRAALLSWATQAATEVWTFGFHNHKQRLKEASRHFTRKGWAGFTKAIERSRIIEMVNENRFVMTSVPRSAPKITKEGLQNGRYNWTVELPLKTTYQSGSKTRSDNLLVRMKIVRVPKLESPNGIGINQWIAYPG